MEPRLAQLIAEISAGARPAASLRGNYDDPFSVLALAASLTAADQDINKLERIEAVIKVVLSDLLSTPVTGVVGRRLAQFQRELGFLFKVKSYTIKCATPFGYSVFFHNRGEGFSFQRHVTHKTEVFHILSVKEQGYVFICDHDEWKRIYEPDAFAAWLSGKADERYERHRYQPTAGDVIVVDKLGTVHSVVGCVLAEYATASTDMVERLHDQNVHKPIPPEFTRAYARQHVLGLQIPPVATAVGLDGGADHAEKRDLPAVPIRGGTRTVLVDSFLTASIYQIEPHQQTDLLRVEQDLASIHVSAGSGRLILGAEDEVASETPPGIPLEAGDTTVVAPGLLYRFANDDSRTLTIAEQRIRPSVCLI